MNERKCNECGTVIPEGAAVCPSCGCPIPVEEAKSCEKKQEKRKIPVAINWMAVISLILGLVIIFMGTSVKKASISLDIYNAKRYSADEARFGADFYTEIYKASDIMVDELNDINGGIGELSESLNKMANVIYYPIGTMIEAMGLGVIAVSCIHLMKKKNSGNPA